MKFLELAKKRTSVRSYSSKRVARVTINRCLEAARLAPSACNSQPWTFIVVDDEEVKAALASETETAMIPINSFVVQAPVLVALVLQKSNFAARFGAVLKNKQYNLIDIGIAAEHFCLQATEEGLGTCMLGWFNEKRVKKILGIPKFKRVPLLITVGYPGKKVNQVRQRKSLQQISGYNSYLSTQ
jgi:nitroreductase